jgi:hypothetical protein
MKTHILLSIMMLTISGLSLHAVDNSEHNSWKNRLCDISASAYNTLWGDRSALERTGFGATVAIASYRMYTFFFSGKIDQATSWDQARERHIQGLVRSMKTDRRISQEDVDYLLKAIVNCCVDGQSLSESAKKRIEDMYKKYTDVSSICELITYFEDYGECGINLSE